MKRAASLALMRVSFARVLAAGFIAALTSGSAWAQTCAAPKTMNFEVQSQVRRDILGFTQGLEVRGDKLFESTGLIAGTTRLTTIDPKTGKVTVLANLGRRFFGEGLTILNNQIFQLSWQEHQAFVYDLSGKLVRSMRNPQEGWGLTNDGTNLIFTDGGDRLYYVNPADFKVLRSVPVKLGSAPLAALNELETVDGQDLLERVPDLGHRAHRAADGLRRGDRASQRAVGPHEPRRAAAHPERQQFRAQRHRLRSRAEDLLHHRQELDDASTPAGSWIRDRAQGGAALGRGQNQPPLDGP